LSDEPIFVFECFQFNISGIICQAKTEKYRQLCL